MHLTLTILSPTLTSFDNELPSFISLMKIPVSPSIDFSSCPPYISKSRGKSCPNGKKVAHTYVRILYKTILFWGVRIFFNRATSGIWIHLPQSPTAIFTVTFSLASKFDLNSFSNIPLVLPTPESLFSVSKVTVPQETTFEDTSET